eukprot:4925272-Pleurochrysis_carterae.AAC.1
MLKPSKHGFVSANLEAKNKSYNPARVKPDPREMCPKDGWVIFQNSEHICGVLDKALLGGGTKDGLFCVLLRDNGADAAAQVMGAGRPARTHGRTHTRKAFVSSAL